MRGMKIKAALLLSFIAVFFSSCSRNNALFNIDTNTCLTLVLGTPADRVFGFTQEEVIFPFSIGLNNYNVSEEEIISVNGSRGIVFQKFRNEVNLNFINSITVDAVDPDDPTFTREVFFYEQFNFNQVDEIELFPSLPDIKDFIRDDRLSLQIEFIFNTPPPRTFDLAFNLEFGALAEE